MLKGMVESTAEETGQNPILSKLRGAPSSSAGGADLKASEVAPPKIKSKFEKPKHEKKSPSAERGSKLCDEEAVNAASPTPGLTPDSTQSLTQAMEIQLEQDRQKHAETVGTGAGDTGDRIKVDDAETKITEDDEFNFNLLLEKEKEKRREIEDDVDTIRKEQSGQRDDIVKTMHVVSKLASASLQDAERKDGVTIFIIKKKLQGTKAYFDAYRNLQKLVTEKQILISAANNGPLITVKVAGPDFIRPGLDLVKEWSNRENLQAAIFRGKSTITQMMELPIRASFSALVQIAGGGNVQVAREAGLVTNWPDNEKKWSICLADKVLVRGLSDLDTLQTNVDINQDAMDEAAVKQLKQGIRQFEQADRFGSLLEINICSITKFGGGSNWGKVRKGGGKGKGKGS